jgi:hypothetical protein
VRLYRGLKEPYRPERVGLGSDRMFGTDFTDCPFTVFDRERVTFTGLAGSAEGPRRRVGQRYVREVPWWRPPFLASFRAGRFDFILLAAHIRWGPTAEGRVAEIAALADWILARTEEAYFGDQDILTVGDFNTGSATSAASRVLMERGFARPTAMTKCYADVDPSCRNRRDGALRSATRVFDASSCSSLRSAKKSINMSPSSAASRRAFLSDTSSSLIEPACQSSVVTWPSNPGSLTFHIFAWIGPNTSTESKPRSKSSGTRSSAFALKRRPRPRRPSSTSAITPSS